MVSNRRLTAGLIALALGAAPLATLHAQRQVTPGTIDASRPIGAVLRPPVMVASDVDVLRRRIDMLESRVAAQQAEIILLKQDVARPEGYVKGFITLGNLSHLPPTDGISYWARP